MRTIYLRKEEGKFSRRILIDMAYLSTHKMIRLPIYYFEDGLYLPYTENKASASAVGKYFLTKDKIIKKDDNHYYFKFPFKAEQVEPVAD